MKKAVFPGSFDPFTRGHHSLIIRALPLFDEIVVAIGNNSKKNYHFSLEKRMKALEELYRDEPKITIDHYQGLTVEYCKKINAKYLLRGLRTAADFEYERTIAQMNNALVPELETLFLLSRPDLSALSSTVVRDIMQNGGDVAQFLPEGYSIA